jgi:hypothetical protein
VLHRIGEPRKDREPLLVTQSLEHLDVEHLGSLPTA